MLGISSLWKCFISSSIFVFGQIYKNFKRLMKPFSRIPSLVIFSTYFPMFYLLSLSVEDADFRNFRYLLFDLDGFAFVFVVFKKSHSMENQFLQAVK